MVANGEYTALVEKEVSVFLAIHKRKYRRTEYLEKESKGN